MKNITGAIGASSTMAPGLSGQSRRPSVVTVEFEMMASERNLRRVEAATDFPLFILAIILVPLLVLPWFVDFSAGVDQSLLMADWLIWAIFASVFTIKLVLAPNKLAFLRANWLELAMVVLPFLRPLRLVRVARAARIARLAVVFGFNNRILRKLANERGVRFASAAAILAVVVGATLALLAERDHNGANIDTAGGALWWATTTMTTVGYGDKFPVTPLGRGIAVALMLFGISIVSVLTATIAAFIVRDKADVQLADVMSKLESIERQIEEIRGSRAD